MLRKIVNITKELNNYLYKDNCIHGDFLCLNNNRNNIKEITNYIDELECEGASVSESDLDDYIGKIINITIRVSNMKEYYDSFSSFLNKNKTTLTVDKFYIKEIDYFYDTGKDIDNQLISNYFKNIQLINILEEISDYQNKIGTELELFFYKVEKGLKLNVDYNYDDLKELNIGNLTELEEDFFNKPDKEERKQIFVNDLIGLLKDNNNYNELLKKWSVLIENYNQSFKFYLSGFSFEKIKTASTGYFQEFTDRTYSQVSKATVNIFIVPTAYIFFIKAFNVSENIIQNILLLITSFIFSYIMHKVVFQNMTEGILAIKSDVEIFKDKIQTNLPEVNKSQLDKLLKKDIPRQCDKINILKFSNWILFILGLVFFIYTANLKYCFFNL